MSVGSNVFQGLKWAWVCLVLLLSIGIIHSFAGEDEKTLSLSLTTSKSIYTTGEPVKVTLTVTNITRHPVTLSFVSSKQYDFIIKQGDNEIWRWSDGKMFAMALTSLTFGPQESRNFQVTWDQTDHAGHKIPSGFYEAVGMFEVMNNPPSKSIPFEIK